jgi:hypothetical protein
MNDDYSQPYR